MRGRYVVVEIMTDRNEILTMCEVEVYGTACKYRNSTIYLSDVQCTDIVYLWRVRATTCV